MAMPRKGSRKLIVDGTVYRWAVRDNGDNLGVVIELMDGGFSVLSHSIWLSGYNAMPSVVPSYIAVAIRSGLNKGWEPKIRGKAFLLEVIE